MAAKIQSLSDRINLLRKATSGEISEAVDNALKRLYPDQDLSFSNLRREEGADGNKVYSHPGTNDIIAEFAVRPVQTKYHRRMTSCGHKYREKQDFSFKETILLYSPQGFVDTQINVGYAKLLEEYSDVKVITDIKEYYPPLKKNARFRREKTTEKTPEEINRKAATSLRAAKDFKALNHSAAPVNGAQTSLIKRRAKALNGSQPQQIDTPEDDIINRRRGSTRREKSYRVWGLYEHKKVIISPDRFSLKGRIARDMLVHPEGDTTVTQFAGDRRTVIHYNAKGRRLEQSTYAKKRVVKSYGESKTGGAIGKKKSNPPSDGLMHIRKEDHLSAAELFNVRRKWEGTSASASLVLEEEDPECVGALEGKLEL